MITAKRTQLTIEIMDGAAILSFERSKQKSFVFVPLTRDILAAY